MVSGTKGFPPAATTLGVLEPPAPIHSLAASRWDVVIVGAGHNGLTCAAYLARAGRKVLVLEAQARVEAPARCKRSGRERG